MHSSSFLFAVVPCLLCLAQSSGLELDSRREPDQTPVVEISVGPPQHPWPLITTQIGTLEASREKFEKSMMAQVQAAAQKALGRVDQQIQITIDRILRALYDLASHQRMSPVSLLSKKIDAEREAKGQVALATVQVYQEHVPEIESISAKIRTIEDDRKADELKYFRQVIAEMDMLADSFIEELQGQIGEQVRNLLSSAAFRSRSVNFLGVSATRQAKIRVVSSDVPYPSVDALVSSMEERRDTAENLVHQKVAMEKIMFFQAANSLAKARLEHVVGVIHRRFESASK